MRNRLGVWVWNPRRLVSSLSGIKKCIFLSLAVVDCISSVVLNDVLSPAHNTGSMSPENSSYSDCKKLSYGISDIHVTCIIWDLSDNMNKDLTKSNSIFHYLARYYSYKYYIFYSCFIYFFRMESFQEAALQMLKEFRALLQHSPVPLPCNRFLQLLALNMYSIESTQLQRKYIINFHSWNVSSILRTNEMRGPSWF